MFYYLNKSLPVQLVLIVLLLAWSVFTVVTQTTVCSAEGQTLFFGALADFWSKHPVNLKVSIISILLLESLLIARFYSVNRFAENHTYIPVVFFLLMMNAGGFLVKISPALFTLVFMTFMVMLTSQEENDRPLKNRIFTSGLLVAIASLIDPVAICSVLFLILALITNRFSKSKEILIMVFGLLFVYVYVFSVSFFTDSFSTLSDSLKNLSFFNLFKDFKSLTVFDYVFVVYTVTLVSYLIIQLKLFYDNKLIVLRKRLVTIHLLMFILIAMLLLSGLPLSSSLLYILLPITLYFSMLSQIKRRIIFHDILIVAFFVLLWL